MADHPIYVGILGFGKIGSGTYKTLVDNQASIDRKVGRPVRVKRLVDVDWTTPRPIDCEIPAELTSTSADDVLEDPDIAIVVETIGGTKPAREFVLKALESGKNVVTSNKELIARHGKELFEAAQQRQLDLMFEGSVGGGIPILRPLKQCLAANRIGQIMGIVNGTTNFILTQMAEEGAEFGEALSEAQQLGYAEADPTNDVEGFDATFKLAILASIGFETRVQVESVFREGITGLAARDMEYARQFGCVIKLLAIGAQIDGQLELRVHPTLLSTRHPLAAVKGPFNAIFVQGSSVGEVMFYGPGAGTMPTGSAVAGDIIDVARNIRSEATGRVACTCFEDKPALPIEELETSYYLRLQVADQPGVLAAIATVFGEEGVSLASVLQMDAAGDRAEIVWLTHKTRERQMRRSLERLSGLDSVHEISSVIRAEMEA
ncbi:MAG: homoserine dehydrogenase [Armatimonadetes bacterium]|nr:homoserine dehydrogenase [Armatimonadota bacterium]